MGIRTAVRDNGMGVVPFLILLAVAWLGITAISVWNSTDPFNGFTDQYVGQAAVTGYIGVAVLIVSLLAAVYLYAEAGSTEPGPQRFPPR